jgi:hypothetical protein
MAITHAQSLNLQQAQIELTNWVNAIQHIKEGAISKGISSGLPTEVKVDFFFGKSVQKCPVPPAKLSSFIFYQKRMSVVFPLEAPKGSRYVPSMFAEIFETIRSALSAVSPTSSMEEKIVCFVHVTPQAYTKSRDYFLNKNTCFYLGSYVE